MRDSDPKWSRVLSRLADSGIQIAVVATGGGSGALTRCFARPGASINFVEATIPYSRQSVARYLAETPLGSSASLARASQLASAALARAEAFSDQDDPIEAAGIALVAALPTTTPRPDTDRAYLSVRTRKKAGNWRLDLGRESLDRDAAESLCEQLILVGLAELTGDAEVETQLHLRCDEHGVSLTRSDEC